MAYVTQSVSDLQSKRCRTCEKGTAAYTEPEIGAQLAQLPAGWEFVNGEIAKSFKFKNYHETMAFVNATAWVSHREDHHPDLEVGYNTCRILYSTHSIGGLSENDFICAAKIEGLLQI